ncbi:MAG: adenine deaminase [Bacteroidetes bacterium]|nr:adenine deaminase [Bacteroidota bacterium]
MKSESFEVSGSIVDVVGKRVFKGRIIVINGRIDKILEEENNETRYILPGLIDAHIHIESSMLVPSEFARLAVVHGTVATVSDPHEIANVLGMEGVRFMIENGKQVPFRFYFGASSCVPATGFETAGASLGVEELEEMLKSDDIWYLSEMMNFPGVIYGDSDVLKKLELAKKYRKPVDGHAPGLTGELAKKYIEAGISTDHECYSLEEAVEKIRYGMKVLIREGSAAKNFDALAELIREYPAEVMFCSDDKHPDDLVSGHINQLVKRAFSMGFDRMDVIRCCTVNPVRHYGLDAGLLQQGDAADFILVDDLDRFNILTTYIRGQKVAENGQTLIHSVPVTPVNRFNTDKISREEIIIHHGGGKIRVLQALDGQLITPERSFDARIENGEVIPDPENDILKIVVKNRYFNAPAAVAFVQGFGLNSGAIASCVAHDSHNIIAVGADDESIIRAINAIVESKGGVSVCDGNDVHLLPLPVAGIMSKEDGYEVAKQYKLLDARAKELKSTLKAPFMTLSFMALLVIPELKVSDKGLFDGKKFSFTGLFE